MIESGIPIPPSHGGVRNGLTEKLRELAAAQIGDSFWMEGDRQKNLYTLAKHASGHTGWYTARNINGGVRIWKVKEPGT